MQAKMATCSVHVYVGACDATALHCRVHFKKNCSVNKYPLHRSNFKIYNNIIFTELGKILFCRVLSSFVEFCRVLSSFAEFCRVLSSFVEFSWVSMSFTECCRFFFVLLPHIHFPNFFRSKISLNFQKIARVLPSFTEFCRVSASFCEFFRVFRVLPSFAQFCRVFLGFFSFRMTIVL